jgi:hypothetical protein
LRWDDYQDPNTVAALVTDGQAGGDHPARPGGKQGLKVLGTHVAKVRFGPLAAKDNTSRFAQPSPKDPFGHVAADLHVHPPIPGPVQQQDGPRIDPRAWRMSIGPSATTMS